MNSQVILLDIEGTVSPISFVYDVLFPFAREQVRDFLKRRRSSPEVQTALEILRQDHVKDARKKPPPPTWTNGAPNETESIIAYFEWLMDQDRKSTGLKVLQGMIWEEGYRRGTLKGMVFPEVREAFEKWKQRNILICSYSSGSILAQELLFSNSNSGNLLPFFKRLFDTTTGPKTSQESYQQISKSLSIPSREVLFVSDVVSELDAARNVGLQTCLSIRPGNREQPPSKHPVIHNLLEITV